jgi:hypothetical protein
MEDLLGAPPEVNRAVDFDVTSTTAANGEVTLRVTARGEGQHTFAPRFENVNAAPAKTVTLRGETPVAVEWKVRPIVPEAAWVAVVVADGDARIRRDIVSVARR